jgi:HSP20 family protein
MFFNEMMKLQKELDSMFGRTLDPYSTFSRGPFPAVNLFETENGLVMKAELPSVKREDLALEVEGDHLLLSGKRVRLSDEKATYHRHERRFGEFKRKIKLPYRVNSESVDASLKDGVLTVHFEKDQRDQKRKITVM